MRSGITAIRWPAVRAKAPSPLRFVDAVQNRCHAFVLAGTERSCGTAFERTGKLRKLVTPRAYQRATQTDYFESAIGHLAGGVARLRRRSGSPPIHDRDDHSRASTCADGDRFPKAPAGRHGRAVAGRGLVRGSGMGLGISLAPGFSRVTRR